MWRYRKNWLGIGATLLLSFCLPIWPIQVQNCFFDYWGVIDPKTGVLDYTKAMSEEDRKQMDYCSETHTEFTWFWKSDWCPSFSISNFFSNHADTIYSITHPLGT